MPKTQQTLDTDTNEDSSFLALHFKLFAQEAFLILMVFFFCCKSRVNSVHGIVTCSSISYNHFIIFCYKTRVHCVHGMWKMVAKLQWFSNSAWSAICTKQKRLVELLVRQYLIIIKLTITRRQLKAHKVWLRLHSTTFQFCPYLKPAIDNAFRLARQSDATMGEKRELGCAW